MGYPKTRKETVDDSEESVDNLLKDSPDNSIDDSSMIETAGYLFEENSADANVKFEESEDMLSLPYPEVRIKEEPETTDSADDLTFKEEAPDSKSSKVWPGMPGLRLRHAGTGTCDNTAGKRGDTAGSRIDNGRTHGITAGTGEELSESFTNLVNKKNI